MLPECPCNLLLFSCDHDDDPYRQERHYDDQSQLARLSDAPTLSLKSRSFGTPRWQIDDITTTLAEPFGRAFRCRATRPSSIAPRNSAIAPHTTSSTARIPTGRVEIPNASVVDALADANARARLADLGQEIFPRDQQAPEALRAYQKAEIEKWWPIIKAAGIKAQ
jgi:hypothetical protein